MTYALLFRALDGVFGFGIPRCNPEIREVRLEDPGSWTDNVCAAELFVGLVEGMLELGPDGCIGFDVDGAGFATVC